MTVGDPRGVLDHDTGRRHNLRLRQWQIGRAIAILRDKAELAGITVLDRNNAARNHRHPPNPPQH
ncbi:hypothetical protein [Dactylosporangium darangshiense]|uniref:Transposase n=1 Tax=Dactylosporangium darangshiense TaxID=579108 RepID=A0ABP8DQI8_9ACTN